MLHGQQNVKYLSCFLLALSYIVCDAWDCPRAAVWSDRTVQQVAASSVGLTPDTDDKAELLCADTRRLPPLWQLLFHLSAFGVQHGLDRKLVIGGGGGGGGLFWKIKLTPPKRSATYLLHGFMGLWEDWLKDIYCHFSTMKANYCTFQTLKSRSPGLSLKVKQLYTVALTTERTEFLCGQSSFSNFGISCP